MGNKGSTVLNTFNRKKRRTGYLTLHRARLRVFRRKTIIKFKQRV